MSQIFDALQKSEAERSGTHAKRTATELLQAREHAADAENQPTADTAIHLWPLAEPDGLQRLQSERKREGAICEPHTLETNDEEREELMTFAQQVFLLPGAKAPRTVVLTSTEPGNGSSWIACRVADILSSHIKSPICLVDANLRSPDLHQMFGVDNHHGLADALQAAESITTFVRRLGRPNLWLLSCGANPTEAGSLQPSSLLSSSRLRFRLAELRQYFQYVLIDSPALSVANDAMILGRAADGVVVILKANSSRRAPALKAVQDLRNAGVRILGAILNRRRFPIPQVFYDKF